MLLRDVLFPLQRWGVYCAFIRMLNALFIIDS